MPLTAELTFEEYYKFGPVEEWDISLPFTVDECQYIVCCNYCRHPSNNNFCVTDFELLRKSDLEDIGETQYTDFQTFLVSIYNQILKDIPEIKNLGHIVEMVRNKLIIILNRERISF